MKKLLLPFLILLTLSGCQDLLSPNSDDSMSSDKDISEFSFLASDNETLNTDVSGVIAGSTITLTVPKGTDVSSLVSDFECSGNKIKVQDIEQVCGVTANDFSNPVTYKVIAENGSYQKYLVQVDVQSSSDKAITSFSFTAADNSAALLSSDVIASISGSRITCTIPEGVDASNLKASFTHTGDIIREGAEEQISGSTINDFFSSVIYTVIAEDGSSIDYTINTEVEVPVTNLVAEYLFSGNANDTSINTYDGTIRGAPAKTDDRFSNAESAYSFDGSDDYIDMYATPLNDSNFNSGESTIALWVNLVEALQSGGSLVYFQDNNDLDHNFIAISFNFASSQYRLSHANTDNDGSTTSSQSVSVDHFGWTFFSVVMDSGISTLYLDGKNVAAFPLQTLSGIDVLTLAASKNASGSNSSTSVAEHFYTGEMDDIRIYNRALEDYEIKALFYEGDWE